MGISKFVIGIMTIAISLLLAGQLAPAALNLAKQAVEAHKDQQNFKLGKWNRRLAD
ncbi:MAG: hypothetical protein JNL11_02235 [Bdellovibrionaceae bacterium]|nr:hypothetical protein [Pseudobdellovibrionaceae bacterium]